MLSVLRFAKFELLISSMYLFFRITKRIIDEFNYSKSPDLFYYHHPSENEQLRTIAQILIQFKELLADKDADKFHRLKIVNSHDCSDASITRMRFWSPREEYLIVVSENFIVKNFTKPQAQALLSHAIAHIVCHHHTRYDDLLSFIYDLNQKWLMTSVLYAMVDNIEFKPMALGAEISFALFALLLGKLINNYFKKIEFSADKYAIHHLGIRQEDLLSAFEVLHQSQHHSIFSLTPSMTERSTMIKKLC